MDFSTMTFAELEERKAAISSESDAENADIDALLEEVRAINAEIEARKAAEAKQIELRAAVAAGAGDTIEEESKEERKTMTDMEIRKSAEYVEAFAKYIKTGKDDECRALLSVNATNGTVAVPVIVEEIVRQAWEKNELAALVRKSYLRGNLKVGFEISADGATIHTEGGAGVSEENLVLGVIELVPQSIKKWISISDEALDLSAAAFLEYIYDELTYQIAKKAIDELLAKIVACGTVSTTTQVAVPVYTSTTVSVDITAQALGLLSDQAANPVIVMNKATWASFKAAQAGNKFNYDPFEGMPVYFNNSLPSFTAATTGETYMIVGDFGYGALMNFPNGDDVNFRFDDITLATSDLVKVIGREFVGIGVVAPNAFAKVIK